MNPALSVQLTQQAENIVVGFQTLPGRIVAAIARGMKAANQFAVSNIQRAHLTGTGPYPPSEHKLGVVTNLLRGSVWSTDPQQIGEKKVQSAIGTNVGYAEIHEFGGRIHHPARRVKVRHRVDARGNLIKQLKNSNLLMFARASHKRARETTVEIPAYDVDMPERAPFRTGLAESMPVYKRTISAEIVKEWKGMSQ